MLQIITKFDHIYFLNTAKFSFSFQFFIRLSYNQNTPNESILLENCVKQVHKIKIKIHMRFHRNLSQNFDFNSL